MQMTKNGYGDLRSVQKTRKATKSMRSFGKAWNSGDKLRVFHPLMLESTEDGGQILSIVSAADWVHRIDAKALKLGGMYSAISKAPRDPDTGKPIGRDVLAKLATISMHILRIEKEAKIDSIANNSRLSEANRATAIKECEEEYDKRTPVISFARIVNIIEVVAVPLNSAGQPDMARAMPCYLDVSEKRGDALLKILDGGRYHVDTDNKLLEVEYTMGASGVRQQDAQVQPDGILDKESIKVAFPKDFETLESGAFGVLPDSAEVIYKRNPVFFDADTRKLLNAFSQYLAINGTILDLLEQDEEGVKALKGAADLLEQMDMKIGAFDVAEEAKLLREEAALDTDKVTLDESRAGGFEEAEPNDEDEASSNTTAPPVMTDTMHEPPPEDKLPEAPVEAAPDDGAPSTDSLLANL